YPEASNGSNPRIGGPRAMNASVPPPPPSAGSLDPQLLDLVEEFTQRLHAGEALDAEAFLRAHPDHAGLLRQLLPALQGRAERRSAPDAAAAPPPAAGTAAGTVLGEYRIVREVGKGGMGVVYEAVQESLGRRVALKVLPLHGASAQARERFQREAQAAARLHHQHIVPVFGVGADRGVHYYAMQF